MTKTFFIVLLLGPIILLGIVFIWMKKTPKILITPQKALLDEPIEISVSNLSPHEYITLEALCKDKDNHKAISRAIFQADENGVVNVAKQAPTSGAYNGVDPMGLFWSMAPTDKDVSKHFLYKYTLNLCEVSLSVFSQDKLRAQKMIYRLPVSPDVEKIKVCEQGITGTLFYPKNMKKGPTLVVVPGSNGGIPEGISQLLASHGYVVLALGYFAAEGLPEQLSMIPLEYFQNAIQWLKKQPQVDENKVALLGHSRGAELVLLFSAMFPKEIAAVVAYGSPCFVLGDFSPEEKSGWTYNNEPIPFIPNLSGEETLNAAKEGHIAFHKGTLEDPLQEKDTFVYAMKKFSQSVEAATIPVEKIQCPILIISGEDDKMLPATFFGNLIMERLGKHGSTVKRKHLHYANAGHNLFNFPNVPSTDYPVPFGPVWGLLGGTAEGNARANKELWQDVLNFLDETLK